MIGNLRMCIIFCTICICLINRWIIIILCRLSFKSYRKIVGNLGKIFWKYHQVENLYILLTSCKNWRNVYNQNVFTYNESDKKNYFFKITKIFFYKYSEYSIKHFRKKCMFDISRILHITDVVFFVYLLYTKFKIYVRI